MTTKHNRIVIAVSILIAAAIPLLYKAGVKGNEINYKTFHQNAGWGYDIVVNGKTRIHQEYIPAIAQKKEFVTETEAEKAAQLVIYKLKNNKLPTLSLVEVEQICSTGDQ